MRHGVPSNVPILSQSHPAGTAESDAASKGDHGPLAGNARPTVFAARRVARLWVAPCQSLLLQPSQSPAYASWMSYFASAKYASHNCLPPFADGWPLAAKGCLPE